MERKSHYAKKFLHRDAFGAIYSLIPKRRLYNATVGFFTLAALLYTACLVILPVYFLIQFSDDKFQLSALPTIL
ncbi:hypothetical protein ACTXT7_007828 [Hymenolepis weldensis]